jgi:uncharacterized protein (TIGR03435 family)
MASMRKRLPSLAAVAFLALLQTGSFSAARVAEQSSPQAKPSFDVASIRPAIVEAAGGEGSTRSQIQTAPDSLTLRNIDLDEMVEWAYTLEHNQLANPAALHNHRFDIRARAAAPVSEKILRLMLQDLLATRFNLQLHREQKITSVYELVVAKGGPKLPPDKAPKLPVSYPRETFPRVVDGGFVFTNTSMPEFAQQLTELRGIDLPVLDRTGIRGVYDITLKSAAAAVRDPNGPSLLTLIREQLGLKLVAAKDPIEVVVIDHAEEPSGN